MSLVKNKKSTELAKAKDAPAEQPDFTITIPKAKLTELDQYLQTVPHGIAMNVIGFFSQFEKTPVS